VFEGPLTGLKKALKTLFEGLRSLFKALKTLKTIFEGR
jgi:hypothetical protein